MSHTPGPWDLSWDESDGFTIRMGTARRSPVSCDLAHIMEGYAECLYPEDGDQFLEAEANACLMAAAPDLLAALEAVPLPSTSGECEADFCRRFFEWWESHAKPAIDKAKGTQ